MEEWECFYTTVRRQCLKQRLPARELAERSGLTERTVTAFLRNEKRNASTRTVALLAAVLGITLQNYRRF